MSEKLTVLIPCKNEAHNIRACIESACAVAAEILVADSLSTDNTLDIVRQMGGCHIIEREFIDYANFKNWAIPQAAHPWVLVLDADERVSAELAAEISRILAAGDPPYDAYRMRRDNFFLGRPIRHCGWNRSMITRLFRRDKCRYGASRVHERLEVAPEKIGTLRGKLEHQTCSSLTLWMEKQNSYTTIWAEDKHAAGRRTTGLGVLLRPPFRFLHLYIFRGGFLDGTAGLLVCFTSMSYIFLKYAKLWHLGRAAKPSARKSAAPAAIQPHSLSSNQPDGRRTA